MAVIYSYPIKLKPSGGDTMIISDMADRKRTKQVLLTDLKTLINTTYTLTAVDSGSAAQGGEVDLQLKDSDGVVNNVKLKGKSQYIDISQTIPNQVDFEIVNIPSDANFIFTQSIPSVTWNITHDLDKFCSVTVVSDSNQIMIGDVNYLNTNSLTITFSAAFSGKAYLN
tara:strand:- start:1523 stop:2029 length:507 start_codon:yes stop_codon:yes gene_type:complete